MTVVVHGTCDEKFASVRDAFANNFELGREIGASVCMTVEGETVVDLWAGYLDEAKTQEWQKDTIVNVWSTTKTMMAMVALMLADRGDLDLYAPVSKYWPEFAQNGKDKVEVRMFLSHSAGLSGLDTMVTEEDLWDHDKIASLLAAQAPWWEPGTQSGYHAITQGYLVNELVRRVTGKTLGTFFREEVAEPLNADFHIGTPAECDERIGLLSPPEQGLGQGANHKEGSIGDRTFRSPAPRAEASWEIGWRRSEIPAANGHGNARSVAEIHAALANGGVAKGKHLLSEEGVLRIFDEQTNGDDLCLSMPVRYGMGFGLNNPIAPISPNARACFWGGWGGSLALIDVDAHMSLSYVMNNMVATLTGDPRTMDLVPAAYGSLMA